MFLFGLAVGLSASAQAPLSVMSFNIRHGTATDKDNSWEQRKGVLTDAIKKYSPDIIGAQECLLFQADFIIRALPEYHWLGIGREADGGGEFAAVFYKKSVLSPIETGNFWLSETPEVPGSRSWGSHCTRMVTWAKFRHIESGRFFFLFNTHFDHGSEEARVRSAHLLLERVKALASDLPAIITGDFNAAAENSAPWRILTEGGLSDTWLAAEKIEGPEVTFGNFLPPPQQEKKRIDWVFSRGPIRVEHCETALYNENGRYPSDHYPVFAKFELIP